jgi:hypothetical protein
MKKIFAIICTALFLAVACSTENKGYGYNVKSEVPASSVPDTTTHPQEKISSFWDKFKINEDARYMKLYDLNGEEVSYCRVLKGQFDGRTWYVFTNREGEFCVIEAK